MRLYSRCCEGCYCLQAMLRAHMLIRSYLAHSFFQYYNDMPRVLEAMSQQHGAAETTIVTDTCLRGGSSFTSLMREGNGMEKKFVRKEGRETSS